MGGGTHLSKVIPVRLVSSKNKTLCVVLRYVPDRYFKRPTAIAAVGCWWWGGRQAGRQIKKKRGRERIYYGTVSSLAARVLRRYCSETIPRYSEDASWRSRTRFCQANWEGGLGLSTYSIVVGVRPAESGPTRQGHRSTTGRVGSPPPWVYQSEMRLAKLHVCMQIAQRINLASLLLLEQGPRDQESTHFGRAALHLDLHALVLCCGVTGYW